MSNHYHLALETPNGNLSEGMRWLQSVFARRFNGFRKEAGHLFQGRFKSLKVENDARLGWLSHYIHLNPARAKMCKIGKLNKYRWSSYWYLLNPKVKRPKFLKMNTCLAQAGSLKNGPVGRRKYTEYLEWLAEDEPAQKDMAFERMSKGWAIGSREYRKQVSVENQKLRPAIKRTYAEAREERNLRWEAMLDRCLVVVGKTVDQGEEESKSADWKVGVAAFMKRQAMTTNAWLADRLHMGADAGVSRYATEAMAGERPGAAKWFKKLSAKIKD